MKLVECYEHVAAALYHRDDVIFDILLGKVASSKSINAKYLTNC